MIAQTELRGDTLVVPDGDTFIVYSPAQGKIVRIRQFPATESEIERLLRSAGFFVVRPYPTGGEDRRGFGSLTLLVTRRCNLNCVYCQVFAPPHGPSMSLSLALGSVDWFMSQLREDVLRVTFHGGGEPTLEEDLICAVVEQCVQRHGREYTRFLITTNGTGNGTFLRWLAEQGFGISISADGPPDIQNRNRPMADGGASSPLVEENIRRLVEIDAPLTIRLTFSPIDDIERIIRYFGKLGVKSLHLEPLFPYGRNYEKVEFGADSANEIFAPRGDEFVANFLRALDVGREYGMKIYNGHLLHFTGGIRYFCGAASGRAALVTHDGHLTACLEVVDAESPNAEMFLVGRWDAASCRFTVEEKKLDRFRLRHADALRSCQACYARYHCAGGCAVKAVRSGKGLDGRDAAYCSFTRHVVPVLVRRIAAASGV